MKEPTYPAWIETTPEPERTRLMIMQAEIGMTANMEGARISKAFDWDSSESVRRARAANHRILALRRRLREMGGEGNG